MFINFNPNTGVTVTSYRSPDSLVGDVSDLLLAVECNDEPVTCSVDGVVGVLCDSDYLANLKVSQNTVETVYNALMDN